MGPDLAGGGESQIPGAGWLRQLSHPLGASAEEGLLEGARQLGEQPESGDRMGPILSLLEVLGSWGKRGAPGSRAIPDLKSLGSLAFAALPLPSKHGSWDTHASSGHSREASVSRHKRWRSPDGSPGSLRRDTRNREQKVKPRPAPAGERRHDKPYESSRAGRSVPSPKSLEEPQHRPRSPGGINGSQVDVWEERPTPAKRRRGLSPEACVSIPRLLSGVLNHLGGLEVALDELRAPGGAFLPGSAGATQPSASQRAWLTWQLAHAGAALHWALATLDSLLASGPWPTGPPYFAPAPGCARTVSSTLALGKLGPLAPEREPDSALQPHGALLDSGLPRLDAQQQSRKKQGPAPVRLRAISLPLAHRERWLPGSGSLPVVPGIQRKTVFPSGGSEDLGL
ncbi:hypothetical protein AAY473_022391 [Plecturocebus cupreus]